MMPAYFDCIVVPICVMTATAAIEMKHAIMQYSTAVAPLSSAAKRFIRARMGFMRAMLAAPG